MSAVIINNQTPGGARSPLASELPLDTPYMLQVFPVYACNFKCNYCIFSVPLSDRGFITSEKNLSLELFKKCIDDLGQFPSKLRMLRFAGTGEPLLHHDLAKMVDYAVQADVAESIDIVTNGSLLTETVAQDLVSAGVNRIRVSIQGTSSEKYIEITNNYQDLETIVTNVRYLHNIKGATEIYVKIIDSALSSSEDEKAFYTLFSEIADMISVEHILPASPKIDYSQLAGDLPMDSTQNGAEVSVAEVCPQPFYMMQLNPDGMMVPCCAMETPIMLGNIAEQSLSDIWHGPTLNKFRIAHLSNQRHQNETCSNCQQFRYAMFPEDLLDQAAPHLLELFSKTLQF